MSTNSIERVLQTSAGPIGSALPIGNTPPLTTTGILNASNLSTTPVKVLSAGNQGLIRRVSIMCVTAARNIAWTTVTKNATPPTMTAVGDGSANEGKLIMGGGGAYYEFNVLDHLDLYIVASAASTAYQFSVVEQ